MPTEIRASYRRVYQVRAYESETIELTVTEEVEDPKGDAPHRAAKLATLAQGLHTALAKVGDEVLLARMTTTAPPSPLPGPLPKKAGRSPSHLESEPPF